MGRMKHCSMSFTPESRARIEAAEETDTVEFLDDLRCQCGQKVEARRSSSGWWEPTTHFPYKTPPTPEQK